MTSSAAQLPPADPVDRMDDAAFEKLFPADGGPRRLASLQYEPPRERSRFRVYTPVQLHALPPLEWLVDGMIPAGGLVAVAGPPKSGKTFVVVDLANCVATGRPFLGHRTRHGGVTYLSAEGRAGLPVRQAAWEHARNCPPHAIDIAYIMEGANLLEQSDAWHLARATVDSLANPPALVVIDTLARVTAGGEENSATDMGLLIANVDYIRERTGAAVLLVHHTNASGERERGSTALRGAVDVLIMMEDNDGQRVLTCEAMKDGEPFAPISVDLSPVTLPDGQVSVVPYRSDTHWSQGPSAPTAESLSKNHVKALAALEMIGPAGAAATTWQRAAGIPERSFYRAQAALASAGFVDQNGARYIITSSGVAALYHRRTTERFVPIEGDTNSRISPDESRGSLPPTATVTATDSGVTATSLPVTAKSLPMGGKGGELPSNSLRGNPLGVSPMESSEERAATRARGTATATATKSAVTATKLPSTAKRQNERLSGRDRAAGADREPPPWDGPKPWDD